MEYEDPHEGSEDVEFRACEWHASGLTSEEIFIVGVELEQIGADPREEDSLWHE
jgi:hypothetical protein